MSTNMQDRIAEFEHIWLRFFNNTRISSLRGFTSQSEIFEKRIKPTCLTHVQKNGNLHASKFLATSMLAYIDLVAKSIASDIASIPESEANLSRRSDLEKEASLCLRVHCGPEIAMVLAQCDIVSSIDRFNACKKLSMRGSIGTVMQMCWTCIGTITHIPDLINVIHHLVATALDFQTSFACMTLRFDVLPDPEPILGSNEYIPDYTMR
jgi:hypothetical protein